MRISPYHRLPGPMPTRQPWRWLHHRVRRPPHPSFNQEQRLFNRLYKSMCW